MVERRYLQPPYNSWLLRPATFSAYNGLPEFLSVQTPMPLEKADWHDILQVLHETVHIWSAGLSDVDYQRLLISQMQNFWFRRNCEFLVSRTAGKISSSCKLYTLQYSEHGHSYKIAGLGAVYTQLKSRNLGSATDLINEVIDRCEDNEYDGVVLYSEIDPDFYADFGFESLGSVDFNIELSSQVDSSSLNLDFYRSVVELDVQTLSVDDIPFLSRHYTRWLRSQPFGVDRNNDYWRYKLLKEKFLNEHSKKGWAGLSLLKIDESTACSLDECGYAIIEISGENLRVLEIIGSEGARKIIWANLLSQILKGRVKRLRGWEAVIRDLEPTYKVKSLGLSLESASIEPLELFCNTREWGQGMILCLNPELEKWLRINPCPMLEFDHL